MRLKYRKDLSKWTQAAESPHMLRKCPKRCRVRDTLLQSMQGLEADSFYLLAASIDQVAWIG